MQQLLRILALMILLPLVGTLGFRFIENDYSWMDALFMAVTTLTTVGYGEVHHLSSAGRVFVIVYLYIGLGAFTYSLFQLGDYAYRLKVRDWFSRRKMDAKIKSMSGHFIVCGFGRMGRTVCRQLSAAGIPFVIVDRDIERLEEPRQNHWPWLTGDASSDDVLKTAGVERARGLAAVLGDDADNVFVVLSARLLAPQLQIIARATDEQSVAKLQKAGANRVVRLYDVAATRVAHLLVNPNIEDFFEVLTTQGRVLDLAEVNVDAGASFSGKRLDQTDFRERGIIIVAIRRAGGELVMPPPAATTILPGDCLIALGNPTSLAGLTGPG
jgi:voltage-gated potassium channel